MTLKEQFQEEVESKLTKQMDSQKEYIKKTYSYDDLLSMLLDETIERWYLNERIKQLESRLKYLKRYNSVELQFESSGMPTDEIIKAIKKFKENQHD